jgi:integrase
MTTITENESIDSKKRRSGPRYWVEIKGKLYARLQYKTDSGKYQTKYKSISDKRTAKRVVDEMRRELEIHGQEILQSDKLSFDDLAEKYSQGKLTKAEYSNGIKVSGRRSLLPVLSSLKALREYFGRKMVRSIKANDIEAYRRHRINTPTSSGTQRKIASVNRELEVLRAMFNFAIQNEWLIKNPLTLTKGIISKAAETERDRILSFDEERRLLEACTGRRGHLKSVLICAMDTAMRRGEIFKMRWLDVSFGTGEIYIPQTNTKTEESRTVGITPRLRRELDLLWEASPKDKDSLVFGITDTIKTAWKTACEMANLVDFRFHDCRHTATTRMIASGSPHTEVMKITGHSQLKTFLRYLNITTETANKVASNLHSYLSERQFVADSISDSIN